MTDNELKRLISKEIKGLLSEQPVPSEKAPSPTPAAPKKAAPNDVNKQLQLVKQELAKLEQMIAGK